VPEEEQDETGDQGDPDHEQDQAGQEGEQSAAGDGLDSDEGRGEDGDGGDRGQRGGDEHDDDGGEQQRGADRGPQLEEPRASLLHVEVGSMRSSDVRLWRLGRNRPAERDEVRTPLLGQTRARGDGLNERGLALDDLGLAAPGQGSRRVVGSQRAGLGTHPAQRGTLGFDARIELTQLAVELGDALAQSLGEVVLCGGTLSSPAQPSGFAHEARTEPSRS